MQKRLDVGLIGETLGLGEQLRGNEIRSTESDTDQPRLGPHK